MLWSSLELDRDGDQTEGEHAAGNGPSHRKSVSRD